MYDFLCSNPAATSGRDRPGADARLINNATSVVLMRAGTRTVLF